MPIGTNIKKRREAYDIEQQELARRVGISKAMMCYIEAGTKIPSLAIIIRLADTLNCTLDELVGRRVS